MEKLPNNFKSIRSFSLFNKKFMYIDSQKYYADDIFIDNFLDIKYTKDEFSHPDYDFVFIFVKVKYKDISTFIECMDKLDKKMMLIYKQPYIELKNKFNGILEDIQNGVPIQEIS